MVEVFEVKGTNAGGYLADVVPDAVAELAEGTLGSPQKVEDELDLIKARIRTFWQYEPDLVMRLCGALSARLSDLYIELHRAEGRVRAYRTIRTQQVRTLMEEIDRQYKGASRLLEMRRQDIELMR